MPAAVAGQRGSCRPDASPPAMTDVHTTVAARVSTLQSSSLVEEKGKRVRIQNDWLLIAARRKLLFNLLLPVSHNANCCVL